VVVTDRVGDGTAADPFSTTLKVFNTSTGAQVGSTRVIAGLAGASFNAEGTVAAINAFNLTISAEGATEVTGTAITMLNLTTGAQIGTPITRAGLVQAQPNSDGSRAVLATIDLGDPGAGIGSTTVVTVVNTATGADIGSPVTLSGIGGTVVQVDASRVLVVSQFGTVGTTIVTAVAVINTNTGAQIGSTVVLTGHQSAAVTLSPDRTRAFIATATGNGPEGDLVGRFTVINTITGTRVGSTLDLPDYLAATITFSADGTRAIVTALNLDDGLYGTGYGVLVFDTGTGANLVTPFALDTAADVQFPVQINGAGTRAVLVTSLYGETVVSVIDTLTGARTDYTVDGHASAAPRFSPGGTSVQVVTTILDPDTLEPMTAMYTINTSSGATTTVPIEPSAGSGSDIYSADGIRILRTSTGSGSTTVTILKFV
jgi:hypothetical protein